MQFHPIRKGQVQAVNWDVLQQICQTLMNEPLGRNSMMISKRVNANASTLARLNLRQGLLDESDICMMIGKCVNANASTLVRLNLRQGLRP